MAVKFQVKFKGDDLGVFDSDEVTMNEALTLENETGMTIDDMVKSLGRSSANGVQAVVWFRFLQLGRVTEHPYRADFKFKEFDVALIGEPDPDPTEATDEVAELERAFKKSETSTSVS